jgi:cell wall-associated NlpC family hydrolase
MITREEKIDNFIQSARSFVGSPFKHQGRTKNGIDCIGLIIIPLNELGFFSYDNKNYKRYGFGDGLIEVIKKYCYELDSPYKLEKGDILLYSNGRSQHLAIYTGNSIIHANNKIGKVVEHSLDNYWITNISKAFRYRGE